MKIVFFSEVYKPTRSGVVTSIINFKKELERRGHKVIIITPKKSGYKNREKGIIKLNAIKIPETEYAITLPSMNKLLKRCKNADIIHCHHPFLTGILALYTARMLDKPIVFTSHSNYEDYALYVNTDEEIARRLIRAYIKSFLQHMDKIIVPSETLKKYYSRIGIKNTVVVPTGINTKFYSGFNSNNTNNKLPKRILLLKKKYNLLLYVGRLDKDKNIMFLPRMMRELNDKVEELIKKNLLKKRVFLLLIGRGMSKQALIDEFKELGVKNYLMLGSRRPENIVKYYKAIDIFISPSKQESQGLTLLEAMAAGKPVVTFKNLGSESTITNNKDGYYVNKEEDFINKILLLLRDHKTYNRISKHAVKKAMDYSIEKTTDKLLSVYEKVILERKKRRLKKKAFKERIIKALDDVLAVLKKLVSLKRKIRFVEE